MSGVGPDEVAAIRGHFEAFLACDEAAEAVDQAHAVLDMAGCVGHRDETPSVSTDMESTETLDELVEHVAPCLSFKHKRVFDTLLAARERARSGPQGLASRRSTILVSGAGPVGLRAALEARLLGHNVTIVERRDSFSRHNIIKTSKSTLEDLYLLGAAQFMPTFSRNSNVLHMGTREIQMVLLKACCLLGVNIRYGEMLMGLAHPDFASHGAAEASWSGWTLPTDEGMRLRSEMDRMLAQKNSQSTAVPAQHEEERPAELAGIGIGVADVSQLEQKSKVDFVERAQSLNGAVFAGDEKEASPMRPPSHASHLAFESLLVADGEQSWLTRNLGFDRKMQKFAPAVGIVVNLNFSPESETDAASRRAEKLLPEFVNGLGGGTLTEIMGTVTAETGLRMEGLEYMRGSTHFLAATVVRESLIEQGVVRQRKNTVKDLLSRDNVDLDKLRAVARTLANVVGIPSSCPFAETNGVHVFDFSTKGKITNPLRLLGGENGTPRALVLPVGDAWRSPFWPQGLGVNKGIHSGLDAVWAAHVAATHGYEIAVQERKAAELYIEWSPLGLRLTPENEKWTADPASRYSRDVFKDIMMEDIQSCRASSRVLPRIQAQLGVSMPSDRQRS